MLLYAYLRLNKRLTKVLSTLWEFHVVDLRRKHFSILHCSFCPPSSLWTDDVGFAGKKMFET